ncbi:PILR alpha-associated neural protein [Rhinatrema bivittatum]|uniref:PILR alpha-associated neural protein n=1 Tax=Rhinatrema bivittatum TaxID=194408 RepID=UPI001125E944|nr:PILR alpha-associated neural protein [Rhinatrema bivittatum]
MVQEHWLWGAHSSYSPSLSQQEAVTLSAPVASFQGFLHTSSAAATSGRSRTVQGRPLELSTGPLWEQKWHIAHSSSLQARRKRQGLRPAPGQHPVTPAGYEEGLPSSQYPWAIMWGPTVADEEDVDPSSADTGSFHPDYRSVLRHGTITPLPDSHPRHQGDDVNLRETPATLQPFLFGPRTEGADPQLYVTISISIIIVLVATGIILKFCWDRNQKRRPHSVQQNPLHQEESQQPLTDLSPGSIAGFSPYSDSPRDTPENEGAPALRGGIKSEPIGSSGAFHWIQ